MFPFLIVTLFPIVAPRLDIAVLADVAIGADRHLRHDVCVSPDARSFANERGLDNRGG